MSLQEVKYESRSVTEVRQKRGTIERSVEFKQESATTVDRSKPTADDVSKRTTEDMSKRASLKDLCLEDKQRIANLVKELAR